MAEISALFFDIGGVLLSNAWDRDRRLKACQRFGLDPTRFEARHVRLVDSFERGHFSLEDYLREVLDTDASTLSQKDFREFFFGQSAPHPSALESVRKLARSGRYTMAALSNESKELNEFRIERFGLREFFSLFFSSCYTGWRKPEPEAFRVALGVTQRAPGECLFLDDRPENVTAASRLGMQTLLVRNPEMLGEELATAGVG